MDAAIPAAVLTPEQAEVVKVEAARAAEALQTVEQAVATLEGDLTRAQAHREALVRSLNVYASLRTLLSAEADRTLLMLNERAVGAYINGATPNPVLTTTAAGSTTGQARETILDTLITGGFSDLDQIHVRAVLVNAARARTHTEIDSVDQQIEDVSARLAETRDLMNAYRHRANTLGNAATTQVPGFVFPVAGPYRFSNDWGNPRSGGRSHKGTDIVAAHGTPLVSVERGVIGRLGYDRLGGTKIWFVGASGTSYYYAHLSGYAPGLVVGALIEPGQVIGFVGDTGNAKGGVAHLHFQIHPGGGNPINPYPLLVAVASGDPNNQRRS